MFEFLYTGNSFTFDGTLFSVSELQLQIEINNKLMKTSIKGDSGKRYKIAILGTGISGILSIGRFRNMLTMKIDFTNDSELNCSLGKCYFIHNTAIGLPDNSENKTVLLIPSGSCGFNKNIRLNMLEGDETTKIFSTVNRMGMGGISFGFITFDRCFCNIEYRKNSGGSQSYINEKGRNKFSADYKVSAYCDFNKFSLGHSKTISSETFFIEENTDPYKLPESFAYTVQEKYNLKPRKKMPIGWIDGWNYRDGFTQENIEMLIMQNVDAINKRLKGFGVKYIWMSTLNLKNNLPGNWNLDNLLNFPYGLKHITDYCKDRGLETGAPMLSILKQSLI